MPDMNEKELDKVVAYYIDNKDFIGAKNHVESFGSQIEGYDVQKKLKEIDKQSKKSIKEIKKDKEDKT